MSEDASKATNGTFPALSKEEDELVEKEIRDRFKKMCEGYFDSVSKKLVIEHNVRIPNFLGDSFSCNVLSYSVCKSKIAVTTRHISAPERSLRTVSKPMRR